MKIAFIDHLSHKKTKSSQFFIDIISKNNDITIFWEDIWNKKSIATIEQINNGNFDIIIFWQSIKEPTKIKNIKCKNIFWVPMYDSEIKRPFSFIQLFGYLSFDIKIISLSKNLTKKLNAIGFKQIIEVQYYPKPNFSLKKYDSLDILFWQRIKKVNWDLIKKLINNNKINSIIFKNNPDLGNKVQLPSSNDIKEYNISVLKEWLNEDEYSKIINDCNIYIAPREYEGIGMGFLDAMANGLVVISPDNPTANEYIKNGLNGYLYNVKKPQEINILNLCEIQKNVKTTIEEGYNNWQRQQLDIINFLNQKNLTTYNKKVYYIYLIYGPIMEFLTKLKRLLKIKLYK